MRRLAAIALVWTLTGGTARADDPPVFLEIEECVGVDADTVARIVEVEMRTSLTDGETPDGSDATRVTVGCDGPLLVLHAVDPVTGKHSSRTIDLAYTSALARERTLALSIVELVVASWSELAVVREPAAPIVERQSGAKTRSAAQVRVRERLRATEAPHYRPSVALLARAGHTSAGTATGVGAMLRVDAGARFGWGIELATHHASADRERGTVGVDFSGAAAWGDVRASWRRVRVRAGAGVRLDWVRMTGETDDGAATAGDSFSAVGGGPLLGASAGVALSDVVVELGAELAYRVLAVRGQVTNDRDVELDGVSLAANLAVGWRW